MNLSEFIEFFGNSGTTRLTGSRGSRVAPVDLRRCGNCGEMRAAAICPPVTADAADYNEREALYKGPGG